MFVYAAFDTPGAPPLYAGEALVSARSLRRHTARPIRLVTNNAAFVATMSGRPDFPFTAVTLADAGGAPFKREKIRAVAAADGDVVFLDCDTICLADLSRVFEIAPFDLAAVEVPVRRGIGSMDAAVRHELKHRSNLNSGVLFVRAATAGPLADAWLRHFDLEVARKGPGAYDQPALRAAVAERSPAILPLPHNYNFRAQFGGLLSGACFVVHTHFTDDVRRLAARGFPPAGMDRLIDHVGKINDPVATDVMAPVRGRRAAAVDWRRGRRGVIGRLVRAVRG